MQSHLIFAIITDYHNLFGIVITLFECIICTATKLPPVANFNFSQQSACIDICTQPQFGIYSMRYYAAFSMKKRLNNKVNVFTFSVRRDHIILQKAGSQSGGLARSRPKSRVIRLTRRMILTSRYQHLHASIVGDYFVIVIETCCADLYPILNAIHI